MITDIHIKEDIDKLHNSQGTTEKGIAPCYKDKYARKGILAKSVKEFEQYLWMKNYMEIHYVKVHKVIG